MQKKHDLELKRLHQIWILHTLNPLIVHINPCNSAYLKTHSCQLGNKAEFVLGPR